MEFDAIHANIGSGVSAVNCYPSIAGAKIDTVDDSQSKVGSKKYRRVSSEKSQAVKDMSLRNGCYFGDNC